MQPKIVHTANESLFASIRATSPLAGLLIGSWLALSLPADVAHAQGVGQAGPQAVPRFWGPRRRPARPGLSRITVVRVLTQNDYPPLNFAGPDGHPARFHAPPARPLSAAIKANLTNHTRRVA